MGGHIERISGEIAEKNEYTLAALTGWQNGRRRAIVKGRGDGKRNST